jgi:hypothetical protein
MVKWLGEKLVLLQGALVEGGCPRQRDVSVEVRDEGVRLFDGHAPRSIGGHDAVEEFVACGI